MSAADRTSIDAIGDAVTDDSAPTLPALDNPAGQPVIAYRVGTYDSFLSRMIARLPRYTIPSGPNAGQRPLAQLTTRHFDDATLALLDAWAVVADVLTFYQERIANEGFLRTATERRSLEELARGLGYELNPGVGATTYLAFDVEDAAGAPGRATVPQGTRVQSIPGQNELPQTFETLQPVEVRADWNTLRPLLTRPQTLSSDGSGDVVGALYLSGIDSNVRPGDMLWLGDVGPAQVTAVAFDGAAGRTRVELSCVQPLRLLRTAPPPLAAAVLPSSQPLPMSIENIRTYILGYTWEAERLDAFLTHNGWSTSELAAAVAAVLAAAQSPISAHVFRQQLGFFGRSVQPASGAAWLDGSGQNQRDVFTSSAGTPQGSAAHTYLERPVQGILPGSLLLIQSPNKLGVYRVVKAFDTAVTGYDLCATVTALQLAAMAGSVIPDSTFLTRSSTAYVASAPLPISSACPIDSGAVLTSDGESTTIVLSQLVFGLRPGQPLLLSGEYVDSPGRARCEVIELSRITHRGGYTALTFGRLQNAYRLDSIVLCANLAMASHGETISDEVLGSGDGGRRNQRFTLSRAPLSHLPAPTSSGVQNTLTIRVNDVLWQQVPSLYGLDGRSQAYTLSLDEEGRAVIEFGDGECGARLPSGQDNVIATYRIGSGPQGELEANRLRLLLSQPLGVRGVTNPLPARDAAPPEDADRARQNTPLSVRTLERILTLSDYQDFANTFAGIGKAQATALRRGEEQLVHLTVGGADGQPLDGNSSVLANLQAAIARCGDASQALRIDGYVPRYFRLRATLHIDPAHDTTQVKMAVAAALQGAFCFARRDFGQPVVASEVLCVIQDVPSVIAVVLHSLYLLDDQPQWNDTLTARPARFTDGVDVTRGAELLLLFRQVILDLEVA